jgi:ABC-type thiamine transport system substrate-binding protein
MGVLVTITVGVITMVSIVARNRNATREIVREEIISFLQTEQAQRLIERAVDNSALSKKIDNLILILCVNDDKLKNSKLCGGS